MSSRLGKDFYRRDVLEVAPSLLGKILVRRFENGTIFRSVITEVEAYRGTEDLACHASKGRTARTDIMFQRGGFLYIYLIYGMYWMLNIVTAHEDMPQAVLIRGLADVSGPGRITRHLLIGRDFYGEDLCRSGRIWIENSEKQIRVKSFPRIGVDYAGEYWKNQPWRYTIDPS